MVKPLHIKFPPDLEQAVKAAAQAEGMSITAFIVRACRESLGRGHCPVCDRVPQKGD
jgi:hypothetical protein